MTPPAPGGPTWQPPAPGAERHDDRPAWLRQPAPGPGEGPRGWSPTQPPPEPPRGRRVGRLTAVLILLLVVALAVAGLVFATRRDQPASGTATGPTGATPTTRAPGGATPTTRAPSGASATPAGVQAVQRDVVELRDLRFRRKVPVTVESPEKMSRRLQRIQAAELDKTELTRQGRVTSTRDTIELATSAIVSTAAMARDATTHVDPHNSAN